MQLREARVSLGWHLLYRAGNTVLSPGSQARQRPLARQTAFCCSGHILRKMIKHRTRVGMKGTGHASACFLECYPGSRRARSPSQVSDFIWASQWTERGYCTVSIQEEAEEQHSLDPLNLPTVGKVLIGISSQGSRSPTVTTTRSNELTQVLP